MFKNKVVKICFIKSTKKQNRLAPWVKVFDKKELKKNQFIPFLHAHGISFYDSKKVMDHSGPCLIV